MYYTCPTLSALSNVSHGFFTRNGGVSGGIYNSLNCGYGSNDDFVSVSKNRKMVTEKIAAETLCTVQQIHSNDVAVVNDPWEHKDAPKADAIVTTRKNIALGILTADCLPILFADEKNQVIAAAHAGWKGAFSGIIENTVVKMKDLGAKKSEIIATIGPAIGADSYEVGEEFFGRFIEQSSDNKIFFVDSKNKGHFLFDLASYAKKRLNNCGISQINFIAQDTYFNDNEFFSYRRSCKLGEAAYGRQISVITLK